MNSDFDYPHFNDPTPQYEELEATIADLTRENAILREECWRKMSTLAGKEMCNIDCSGWHCFDNNCLNYHRNLAIAALDKGDHRG